MRPRYLFQLLPALAMTMYNAVAGLVFDGETTQNPLEYKCDEEIVFVVRLRDEAGGDCVAGRKLEWKRTGDDGRSEEGRVLSGKEPWVYRTTSSVPGSVRLEVKTSGVRAFEGGALVEKERLWPPPEAPGFAKICKKLVCESRRMAGKPILTSYEIGISGVSAFQFFIPLPDGGAPATGTLLIPEGKGKNYPARIRFQGYGVAPARLGKEDVSPDRIEMLVSAHGIDNLREEAFYTALAAPKGELAGFGFRDNRLPENSYFYGMLLRDLVALRFLAEQPSWNRRDLLVEGGSMGGFQALAMAALDSRVTECIADIPWLADIGGENAGRKLIGWRPPTEAGLACFDSIHFAGMIRCPVRLMMGLGDPVCPAAGRWLIWRALKCPARLAAVQNMGHSAASARKVIYRLEKK